MSATAPKEMWFQTCTAPTGGKCSSRQISSLNDLSAEEQQQLRESGNILTISNPGIFNNREDALKNAAKQNISETNQKGILVVMNPPTGQYDSWWILSSLPSELMYAAYDKLNDVSGGRFLPLSNAEKLNQDLYLQAQEQGYMVDTSNHSRGGLTASVSLKNLNNVYDIKDLPIRKSRFYGTATNVQDYADQLRANGYSYTDGDGNVYQSSAYSAVHKADPIGRWWALLGGNAATGGTCSWCYAHSSYYAEIPEQFLKNKQGQYVDINGNIIQTDKRIKNPEYRDFEEKWGKPLNQMNPSLPSLVSPTNKMEGNRYDKNQF